MYHFGLLICIPDGSSGDNHVDTYNQHIPCSCNHFFLHGVKKSIALAKCKHFIRREFWTSLISGKTIVYLYHLRPGTPYTVLQHAVLGFSNSSSHLISENQNQENQKRRTHQNRAFRWLLYSTLEMAKESKGTKRSTIHDVVAREYTIHLHKHVHGR